MDENTVVVTGVGLVTAAGDACQTWHAIKNGCSAVSWVDLDAGANYPARLPGAIIEHDYWPDGLSKPKRFRSLPEVAKISLVAAYEAVTAARTGGRNPFVNAHRVGVIMGTSLAAAELGIQNHLFVLEGQDSQHEERSIKEQDEEQRVDGEDGLEDAGFHGSELPLQVDDA